MQFECTKCAACCCEEGLLVTVTGNDIARISLVLDLSASEMLRALDFYVPKENEEVPHGLNRIPAVNTERGPAYIALRKMENSECVFLSENLCMIHKIRPGVCKSFPFVFQEKDSSATWGLSAMKEICPGLGTGPEVTEKELEETSQLVLRELREHQEFADEWNANEANPTALSLIMAILSDPRFAV
ncbi:MAG: YkgJ family cysteine cluster protein [Candidatus Thorarchaeota archaeon]